MSAPLTSSRQGAFSVTEYLGRGAFLVCYITYVLSSSVALLDYITNDVKHVEFIFFAVISLLLHTARALLSAAAALPIALIYLYGGLWTYTMMVFVLSLSLPIMWDGVLSVVSRRDYRFLIFLALIAMIPALLSFQFLFDEGLFDYRYGRPRMLLGYFHPKEAAISFAVPMLLLMVMTRSSKAVPWFLGCTFLWLVGSRNITLLIFMGWALRWHVRLVIIVLLAALPMFSLWLVFNDDWYVTIDNLMSLRLSVWTDVLSTTHILKGLDVESGDRFGADNFFVEALVISGPVAVSLIFFWVAGVGLVLRLRSQSSPWPLFCLAMLIFIASFDSGIASTGNFMHVLLWTILLSPLFYRRSAQQLVFTSIKSTERIKQVSIST